MDLVDRNKKRSLISIAVTVVFHALVVVLLFFIGLKYQVPPPAERGILMDVGSLTDVGNASPGQEGGASGENSIHDISEAQENAVTSNDEESTISSSKYRNSKPTLTPKTTPKENDVPAALFSKGKVKGGTGSGQGIGSGDGIGSGSGNNGRGGTGSSGYGASFALSGRSSKSLPHPSRKTDEVGSIVVTIWVNQEGQVTRAIAGARGTTIDNKSLWHQCEVAASSSNFTALPSAPELQKGTITYKFRR
jgi:hypothetical protein